MEKVTVIKIHDNDNGHELWEMDDQEAMDKLIIFMKCNFERGEKHIISIEELTPGEWQEAVRIGEEQA